MSCSQKNLYNACYLSFSIQVHKVNQYTRTVIWNVRTRSLQDEMLQTNEDHLFWNWCTEGSKTSNKIPLSSCICVVREKHENPKLQFTAKFMKQVFDLIWTKVHLPSNARVASFKFQKSILMTHQNDPYTDRETRLSLPKNAPVGIMRLCQPRPPIPIPHVCKGSLTLPWLGGRVVYPTLARGPSWPVLPVWSFLGGVLSHLVLPSWKR